jgi:hypothetical protein
MDDRITFEVWLFKYKKDVNMLFNTIIDALKRNIEIMYPIFYVNINEHNLYKKICKYAYYNSHNSRKRYTH